MVMDDLPSPGFPAVDVGDAVVERERLACHRRLPALGADLVGQISAGTQELVVQPYLPARANVGYLLPHGSDLLPTDLPTTDRVHGRHVCFMRPDFAQWTGIAIEQPVQRRVEPVGRLPDVVFCCHGTSSLSETTAHSVHGTSNLCPSRCTLARAV